MTSTTTTTERCPNCGIQVGPMPEDAANDEMLCNSCYEVFEQEQATCTDIDTVLTEHVTAQAEKESR